MIDPGSSSNRCAAKELWMLRSDSTEGLRDPVGFFGFCLKCFQRGNIRVPLDERRHRSKSPHGRAVQGPNLLGHVSVAGSDADFTILNTGYRIARHVKFLDYSPPHAV